MNRQHILKVVPLVLLLTSLAWWVQAQTIATEETDEPDVPREIVRGAIGVPRADISGNLIDEELAPARPSSPPPFPFLQQMMIEYMESQRPRSNTQSGEQILERLTREIIKVYRSNSDTEQRDLLQGKLRGVIAEHFILRQTARQHELDELEKELNRLKAMHEIRQAQADRIIAARVESLLRDADGLGWGASGYKRDMQTDTAYQSPEGDGHLLFSFNKVPWRKVLEWYAEEADLSLVMDTPPQGTFTYTNTEKYTLAETINVLNSVLRTKGYTLVRRESMLMLVDLEDGIPSNVKSRASASDSSLPTDDLPDDVVLPRR